ncbi:hypothetical protein AWX17_27590 [Priestia megaterium]|nr:hypothetical protein AWX17_27590 [Priestia megaterium]
MGLLVAQVLDAEVEVADATEEVGFCVGRGLGLAEQRLVVRVALGAVVEDVRSLLLTRDLAKLLAHKLVGLLDAVEVVAGREVLADVVVDVLVDLDVDLVRRDRCLGRERHGSTTLLLG